MTSRCVVMDTRLESSSTVDAEVCLILEPQFVLGAQSCLCIQMAGGLMYTNAWLIPKRTGC